MIGWRPLVAGTFCLWAAPSLADVPFTTDDPGLIEPGHLEIAFTLDAIAQRGGDHALAGASADFGVTDRLQLGFAVPVAALSPSADRFAVDELAAHAKIPLVPQHGERLGLVFEPSIIIPFNDRIRTKAGLALPLFAGVTRGEWSIYGGGGIMLASPKDGGDYGFGGLVVSRALGDRWSVGGEVNGRSGDAFGPSMIEAGPGVAFAIDDRFTLAAAHYRTIVHPAAHGDARTLVTLRYAR